MTREPPGPPAAHPFAGATMIRWRDPVLWRCLAAHATITSLLALLDRGAGPWESPYAQVLVAGLAVVPLVAAVFLSVGGQPGAGGAMLASAALMVPVAALGVAEGALALAADAHLATVAAAGCLLGAGVSVVLFGLVRVWQRYTANLPAGSSRARGSAMPGVLVSALLVAVGTYLAPERQQGRRLGSVVWVLSRKAEIQSPFWWWAGWVGVAGCVGSLVVLALTERRRQHQLRAAGTRAPAADRRRRRRRPPGR
ncbi:hypothetical protein [Micromonospora sp. KLBMP9576]|uniref:hypothetical protein n=1 Tax=Micromonospora sp. KLBMP9576 TaxID=3424769 RepID=UPI003D947906